MRFVLRGLSATGEKCQMQSMFSPKSQVTRIVRLMRILRGTFSLIREIRVIRDNPRF